jgi:hypothetical protein
MKLKNIAMITITFLLLNVCFSHALENEVTNLEEYDSYFQVLVFIDLLEDDQQVEKEVLFWNLGYDSYHNNFEIIRGRPFAWGSSKSRNMNIELFSKAMEYDSLGNWIFKGKIQLKGLCAEYDYNLLEEQNIAEKEIQLNFSKVEMIDIAKELNALKPEKIFSDNNLLDIACRSSQYQVKMNSFMVKSYSKINPRTNLLINPKFVQY